MPLILPGQDPGMEKRNAESMRAPRQVGPRAVDLIAAGLKEAEEGRKVEIESAVRECDMLARKISNARAKIEKPEIVGLDELKAATDEIRKLKADYSQRKDSIMLDLQHVDDHDFRDLISFHFGRLEK
jgi:hypothetical protein